MQKNQWTPVGHYFPRARKSLYNLCCGPWGGRGRVSAVAVVRAGHPAQPLYLPHVALGAVTPTGRGSGLSPHPHCQASLLCTVGTVKPRRVGPPMAWPGGLKLAHFSPTQGRESHSPRQHHAFWLGPGHSSHCPPPPPALVPSLPFQGAGWILSAQFCSPKCPCP